MVVICPFQVFLAQLPLPKVDWWCPIFASHFVKEVLQSFKEMCHGFSFMLPCWLLTGAIVSLVLELTLELVYYICLIICFADLIFTCSH